MNKSEKCGYWLMLSNYDIDTIDSLIAGERWVYVAYLCQQAVERQLKGMYVYFMDAEPPKSHNVNFLFSRLTGNPAFRNEADMALFETRKNECEDFLVDIMFYYMSDYPFSYKNIANRFVDRTVALGLFEKTKDMIGWLRSFLPGVEIPKIFS